ncbi:MAG: hypothetical protein F6K18_02020 [Okeania sp. SIO2C2]|nr:hypothetical protein [Okeania sp. SIO2C2]
MFLDDFATEYGLGKNKRVLLVIDQAGWHTSHSLKIPEGLNLIYLPAKSPERQPAERLWPLTNEVVANSSPLSLDELEELLVFRCQQLMISCPVASVLYSKGREHRSWEQGTVRNT